MVPLQIFRCICLKCLQVHLSYSARHDFTLGWHLLVWCHGQCLSQSVIDAARVPKVNLPGYICNHGSPRKETLRRMPYFLHPWERLASTFQKLTLLVPDALLSSLVSTSPQPWRFAISLYWLHRCFRAREHRGVPKASSTQRLVPLGTMVTYVTWDVISSSSFKTSFFFFLNLFHWGSK